MVDSDFHFNKPMILALSSGDSLLKHLHFLIFLSAVLFSSLLIEAKAQTYPNKSIRWVIPSSPGDGTDITGRLIADKLSRVLNQPIVIDNKPGAGGVLGSEIVAKSSPDGYTMIVGNAGSHGINPAIYHKLNYDAVKDFIPVALICLAPNVMVINPKIPVKNVGEFIAYAKSQKTALNYSSGGIGSSAHLSAELFKSATGVEMVHIPYKGSSAAGMAVITNDVSMLIGNLPPLSTFIKSGSINALAVTSLKRYKGMPNVAAMSETLPNFETIAWFGIFAPNGTPHEVIEKINKEVNIILATPEVKTKLDTLDCTASPGSPESFAARVNSDVARWKKLAAEKKISAD
jgi:tripartite-type tricarboxylate transporter receptor subunit TctC